MVSPPKVGSEQFAAWRGVARSSSVACVFYGYLGHFVEKLSSLTVMIITFAAQRVEEMAFALPNA